MWGICTALSHMLKYISRAKETHDEAVQREPYAPDYALDHLRIQMMCIGAVRLEPSSLECVLDRFKTQEMCDGAVMKDP